MTAVVESERTMETTALTSGGAWRTGMVAGGIALVVNLAVLAMAGFAGADMSAQPPGQDAMAVGVAMVAALTAVPVLLGSALLVALRGRGGKAWRILALLGLIVGVTTAPAPFTVEAEGATRVALASMHVITGLVWFVVVRRAMRSQGTEQ